MKLESSNLVGADLYAAYDLSLTFGEAVRLSPFRVSDREQRAYSTRAPVVYIDYERMRVTREAEIWWRGVGVCAAFRSIAEWT